MGRGRGDTREQDQGSSPRRGGLTSCAIDWLDRLNEEFLFGAAGGDTSWWGPSCGWMSAAATGFFRSKGYEAETESVAEDKLDLIGYGDRRLDPPNGPHAFTVIKDQDGRRYLLDFTARQYGYSQFPLVAREGADGSWERLTV